MKNGYITLAFLGVPRNHQPCLLEGPQGGGIATSPLRSWGSQEEGAKIKKGYVTPAFSGVPRRGEENQIWLDYPYLL